MHRQSLVKRRTKECGDDALERGSSRSGSVCMRQTNVFNRESIVLGERCDDYQSLLIDRENEQQNSEHTKAIQVDIHPRVGDGVRVVNRQQRLVNRVSALGAGAERVRNREYKCN